MKRSHRLRVPAIAVATVAVVAVAACYSGGSSGSSPSAGKSASTGALTESAPGITATTITVGSHQPLTGPAAPGYSEIAPASAAYFSYVNAHGGVDDRLALDTEHRLADFRRDTDAGVEVERDLHACARGGAHPGGLDRSLQRLIVGRARQARDREPRLLQRAVGCREQVGRLGIGPRAVDEAPRVRRDVRELLGQPVV